MITPNSPVSRNVNIKTDATSLAKAIRRVCVDKPSSPVRMLLRTEGISIWTHDLAKTMNIFLTDSVVDGLKVKEDCILLFSPDDFSDLLSTKFRGQEIQIQTKANEPIKIRNLNGSSVVYHPADEGDCAMVPDRWFMDKDAKGWIKIPQKNNESCTSKITISRESLKQGLVDMKVANAPYVVFNFGNTKSICTSGHWAAKANQSHSVIEAELEGEEVEIGLSNSLEKLLSICNGNTFIIYKHRDVPFVIIECSDMRLIIAENRRDA
mgnify:CR=1 FL=1|tara:strand:+ start:28627 stop:29424 length:798 start_codon:yes stop_codon:yes gene_type:complete